MATSQVAQQTRQFVLCKMAKNTYGFDIARVREILAYQDPVPVPGAPDTVIGVLNIRGLVVPVVDLRLKFGLGKTPITTDTVIVVLAFETEDSGEEDSFVGALVDTVEGVVTVDEIVPPPPFGTAVGAHYLEGIYKTDDDFILLFDMDEAISLDELLTVSDVSSLAREFGDDGGVDSAETAPATSDITSLVEELEDGEGVDSIETIRST